jgi:hypothetical protein
MLIIENPPLKRCGAIEVTSGRETCRSSPPIPNGRPLFEFCGNTGYRTAFGFVSLAEIVPVCMSGIDVEVVHSGSPKLICLELFSRSGTGFS